MQGTIRMTISSIHDSSVLTFCQGNPMSLYMIYFKGMQPVTI